ncbi:4588_t:CDS:2 [Funneliformis geosporum]|nr:4588_t:CDS:2 [Funneliformis geosporum]
MAVTFSDIFKIIFAVILPPLGVLLEKGCGADLCINILLTLLGYIPAADDYKLRFRYKYLEEGISIFLNDNRCKIYIPVDNIEAISKIQSNVIVLTLNKDKDHASSVNYNSKEGYLEDDPIRNNIYKATSISMIVQESTPQQVIDMVGLHIHYLVNRSNKGTTRNHNSIWGRSSVIPSLPMKDKELLLKCHVGADIRILSFIQPIRYNVIKQKIQAAFEIAEISKLKYKDEEGEFITIINNADFDTASKLYLKGNKLEIWIVE